MKNKMNDNGNIYLQIGRKKVHHARLALVEDMHYIVGRIDMIENIIL